MTFIYYFFCFNVHILIIIILYNVILFLGFKRKRRKYKLTRRMDKTKGANYYWAHNDRITSQKDRIRLDTNQSEPRGEVMALSVWIDSVYPQVLIFTAYILSFDRYGLLSLVCHETRSDIRVHDKAFNYIQILHEIKYEAYFIFYQASRAALSAEKFNSATRRPNLIMGLYNT